MTETISAEAYNELMAQQQKKAPKYHNKKVTIDGITFDSIREGDRYAELKQLVAFGLIEGLRLQVPFALTVNDHTIGTYVADFVYYDVEEDRTVVEDVKGVRTPVYRLKKKLMLAIHGIEVTEV